MHSLIMRFKLHKALKLINKYWLEVINMDEVLSKVDELTLITLEQYGCIKLSKAWGGNILDICRGSKSQIYSIERSELWLNRIFSYVLGIISGVVIGLIVKFL